MLRSLATHKLILFIALSLFIIGSIFGYGRYKTYYNGKGGDCWGYYVYLPSAIIYKDLLKDLNKVVHNRKDADQVLNKIKLKKPFEAIPAKNGRYVLKYTYGVALLLLPFFILSQFISLVAGLDSTGFSPPHIFIIYFATSFYVLLGIWFLEKVLRKIFFNKDNFNNVNYNFN